MKKEQIFYKRSFFYWTLLGIIESLFVFFFSIQVIDSLSMVNNDGFDGGIWFLSITVYSTTVLVITGTISYYTRNFTVITLIAYLFLTIFWYCPIFMIVYDFISGPIQKTTFAILASPLFWLNIFVCSGIILIIKYFFHVNRKLFFPSYIDILQRANRIVQVKELSKTNHEKLNSKMNNEEIDNDSFNEFPQFINKSKVENQRLKLKMESNME